MAFVSDDVTKACELDGEVHAEDPRPAGRGRTNVRGRPCAPLPMHSTQCTMSCVSIHNDLEFRKRAGSLSLTRENRRQVSTPISEGATSLLT